MKMREEIISLFQKYGFEYKKAASNGDFLAFTFKSGFFHNAEIVSLSIEDRQRIELSMETVAVDLERLGFSTKKSFYQDIAEIENTLFEGFFNVPEWKEKIQNEYEHHCEKTLSVLPSEADTYSYIQVPYLKNNKRINQETIIENICKSLLVDGPQLAIIEAPAGFGKTCTSYEIINSLVNDYDKAPIPFFTEFSRDRQARVFGHIFVREVDKSFSSVNSDVVISEVKEGRIVVVLDGFDELLHDNSAASEDNKFENAEPMLETISELLTKNAKIILTSRRSAIFDGEMFNAWVSRYEDKFVINRYRLDKPEIKDWITLERLDALNKTEVDITKLSNPVLLSFLRFVNDEFFSELCDEPSLIVDQYFSAMLEREMDRQELRMNPEQQKELLKLVADDMCENDYTADSKEKIISVIKEKASHLLNEVRTLYSPKDKPTIDKLATTLSNHAFFDRSNQGENNIQFINEFVFGNYIAENIMSSNEDWIASDERFVEPAILSYLARDDNKRRGLWVKLALMSSFLDPSSRMRFEAALTDQIEEEEYSNSDITSITLKNINIFQVGMLETSIFNGCTFHDVIFNLGNLKDITFLNCSFWNCTYEKNPLDYPDVSFYNCRDNNGFIVEIEEEESIDELNVRPNIAFYIFSKLWPIGSPSIERLHYFTGNLFKTDEFTRKEIVKEIKVLKRDSFLLSANDVNFVTINKAKITEIKTILGRD